MDSSAKSLKRVGKTERIGFQIFIDVSFNQDIAMRIIRFCQVTQCGQASPEPMHFSSRNSAFSHDNIINLPSQRCPSSGGLTLIAHPVWLHDDGALALRAARVWLDHTHILREAVMARSAKAILGGYGQGGPTWQLPPTRSNNKSEQQNEASALSR